MAPGRKKPAIALSKVPSVKELCDKLGFQRATSRETSVFTDTTHAYRKSYQTSDGSPGAELTDWNAPAVQQDLTAMALDFLHESGNGERFWSESRRWKEDGDLQYPEDKLMIADLLKQLFWKQNRYALNNQTYGEKRYSESRDQSRDNIEPAGQNTPAKHKASPRQPSVPQHNSPKTQQIGSRGTTPSAAEQSHNNQTTGDIISLLDDDDERNDPLSKTQSLFPNDKEGVERDIFKVPEDASSRKQPESSPKQNTMRRRKFITLHTSGQKSRQGNNEKNASDAPASKKQRIDSASSIDRRTNNSPKRTSDRPKIPRNLPNTVPGKEVDDYLDEAARNDQPTSGLEETSPKSKLLRPHRPPSSGDSRPRTHAKEQMSRGSFLSSIYGETRPTENTSTLARKPEARPGFVVPTAPMMGILPPKEQRLPKPRVVLPPASSYPLPSPAQNPPALNPSGQTPPGNTISSPQLLPAQKPLAQKPPETTAPSTSVLQAKPKSKVRGLFWIITSPEPDYSEVWWDNGQIKGKALSALIEEISSITHRDHIERLKLKLKTPFTQTIMSVQKDAEENWELVKASFFEKIKESLNRDRNQANHFQIWIEPFYEESATVPGEMNLDDGDIEGW